MALAFCHSHEITLRDLETYGVLQVIVTGASFSVAVLQPSMGGLCLCGHWSSSPLHAKDTQELFSMNGSMLRHA